MKVYVYMITVGRDLPIGTAYDRPTLLSLIELARLKDATGVSLHGKMDDGRIISGEMSFHAAEDLAMGMIGLMS